MTVKDPIWDAHKQVLYSYGHKAVLLGVAFLGFTMLRWLGAQKEAHDVQTWTVTKAVQEVYRDALERADVKATVLQATGGKVSQAGAPAPSSPGGKEAMSHAEVEATLGPAAPIPATACDDPKASKTYATSEELIAAVQGRAEACVWAEFRGTIGKVRGRMAAIEHRESRTKAELEEDLKDYTSYANYITQEQSFAATKANAVRQYVGTMLMSSELKDKPEEKSRTPVPKGWVERVALGLQSKVDPTLSEKSPLHILYQVFWYASLLLGVGASSMLFIIILTAIPITNGEGFWTQRISKILEGFPSVAGRSIAVPLLAAAIGGGTLAGATAQTQAGGQARIPESGKVALIKPAVLINSWSLVEGNTYQDDRQYSDDHRQYGGPNTPPSPTTVNLDGVTARLEGLNQRTEALLREAEKTRGDFVEAVNRGSDRISEATRAVQELEQRVDQVQREVLTAKATAGDLLACANDVHVLEIENKSALGQHAQKADWAAAGEEVRDRLRMAELRQNVAQRTQYDPRSAWKRAFGRTLYFVGPAVPATMAARFENEPPSASGGEATLVEALKAMRAARVPPLNRREFEKQLRTALEKPPKDPKKSALKHDQIENLINQHRRTLMRVCSLPRR